MHGKDEETTRGCWCVSSVRAVDDAGMRDVSSSKRQKYMVPVSCHQGQDNGKERLTKLE